MHLEEVALSDLVDEPAATARGLARESGLAFVLHAPAERERIRTDAEKVRHILVNLLSNAVKFTREGSVELDVSVRDGAAAFRVTDTGIGIPPEHQADVFDPFFQVGDPLTRDVGGPGIGLAVARGLARRLGGDVTVSSRPGEGATFTLTLPLESPEGAGAPERHGRGAAR